MQRRKEVDLELYENTVNRFEVEVRNSDGLIDLTGATATARLRPATGYGPLASWTCTILTPAAGVVLCELPENALAGLGGRQAVTDVEVLFDGEDIPWSLLRLNHRISGRVRP